MHYTHREVRYHEDVASLFAHVGGLEAPDSVLLESADITTRSGLQSVAVLRASLAAEDVTSEQCQAVLRRGQLLSAQHPEYAQRWQQAAASLE